jgi:hypothetical protein
LATIKPNKAPSKMRTIPRNKCGDYALDKGLFST